MKTAEPLGHYIDLTTRDGAVVRTFVAESRQAPRAVVVVLQHMDQRRPGSTHKDRSPAASGENRPGVNPHARHMCEAFAREGGTACASVADLAAACDVVISVVVNAQQTEDVLFGSGGGSLPVPRLGGA